ncbi:MAG: S-layer glycoprotein N-glycosyltransferase AglJ [Halovenus sp.]
MIQRDDVCILIPTYNEAAAVGGVIEGFLDVGYEQILVIDGGSGDGTQEIAADAGARVVEQSGSGKGQAVREAVGLIEQPYVLMIDGDATYHPEQADRMVEPLFAGEAEHVVGNRFADMQPGAMTRLNRIGNGIINSAFRYIHGRNLKDILSGYRAFTRESFERLSLSADGFGIETELAVECVRHNVQTTVVPITYEPRPEGSETNLRPVRDGGHILVTLYQMAKMNNPIFYFGSFGVLSILVGLFLGTFVLFRYFVAGVPHEIIALGSGVTLLFGLQLIMFGVLSDLIVTTNRQQRQQIERIEQKLDELETTTAAEEGSSPPAETVAGEGPDTRTEEPNVQSRNH